MVPAPPVQKTTLFSVEEVREIHGIYTEFSLKMSSRQTLLRYWYFSIGMLVVQRGGFYRCRLGGRIDWSGD